MYVDSRCVASFLFVDVLTLNGGEHYFWILVISVDKGSEKMVARNAING
jgi:hypothetical protein